MFRPIKDMCIGEGHACKRDDESFLYYNSQYNFVWIEIPRAASTSLRTFFADNFSPMIKLKRDENLIEFLKKKKCFMVSFVRNPKHRLVSSYMHFLDTWGYAEFNRWAKDLTADTGLDHHWMPFSYYLPQAIEMMSFLGNADKPVISMTSFLEKIGHPTPDISKNIVHVNSSHKIKKENYRMIGTNQEYFDELDSEALQNFQKIFADDIEIWKNNVPQKYK